VLTAAAAMAGQRSDAEAALQELRRGQPDVSLDWIAKQIPFKRDVDREHYLDGLRRAGLHWDAFRAIPPNTRNGHDRFRLHMGFRLHGVSVVAWNATLGNKPFSGTSHVRLKENC
jgi:hypothetical protein